MSGGNNSLFDRFVSTFCKLKEVVKEPCQLAHSPNRNDDIENIINQLEIHAHILERYLNNRGKIHRKVPEGFHNLWKDYKENWQYKILCFQHPDLVSRLDNESEMINKSIQKDDRETVSSDTDEDELWSPNPEDDERFDPTMHRGGVAIRWLREIVEVKRDSTDDKYLANECNIAIEAYDYLTKAIKLDVDGIFERWRLTSDFFIEPSVDSRYEALGGGALHELLRDAVRAFVFGAYASAIATCRAVLEMLLREHYVRGKSRYINKKGEEKQRSLSEIISMAEEDYDFLKGFELKKLKVFSDDVLHKYHYRKNILREDRKNIIEFMNVISKMIDKIPPQLK